MSAVVEYWWIAIPLKIWLWVWIAGKVKQINEEEQRRERRELAARGIDPHEQRKQEIIAQAMKRSK